MTDMRSDVIDNFRSKLRGRLIQPSDPEYDQARTLWNVMIDKRPALIVRCAGAADVRASVAFARAHDLPLAVRGGGHNIGGSALCDDGLVIDLSAMRSVRVDPARRRAWVEGGAILRDFDHEAQDFGLAAPLGINSTTGVGGLTLGGGFGWLSRTMGLTIDHLAGADIVTADGQLRHASASDEPDLFWAIRGGGGNFGVVTTFEFALEPLGPEVTAGLIVFPFDQAKAVLTRYRDLTASMRTDLTAWAIMRLAPPLPFLPPEVHGKPILALAVFSPRKLDEVAAEIDTLRASGHAVGEHIGPVPYSAWQQALDPLLAPPARNYWKSHNFRTLPDAAIDTLIAYAGQLPGPQCEIFLGLLGGKASAPAPDSAAYPHRDALYVTNVHARWETPADDARCISWARDFFRAAAPYAAGSVYINFLTQDEGARIREAYGKNYERLVEIKTRYDPGNLFRHNQNIPPRPA